MLQECPASNQKRITLLLRHTIELYLINVELGPFHLQFELLVKDVQKLSSVAVRSFVLG